jgi:hypothetical protein
MKCHHCGEEEDRYKPPAETVLDWLRSNLGDRSLAPLTGCDTRALRASVQIIEQYGYDRHEDVLRAFRHVVSRMQLHTRELAYHAIAHPLDWSDREKVWRASGLARFDLKLTCSFEPGGSRRDMTEAA